MMQHAGLLVWVKNYVAQPNDADIIVLFSCVVTHKAEAEVRRFVQKWKAQGKKIILTGCGTNITLTDLADESVTLVPVDQLDSFMQQLGSFSAPKVIPFYPDRSRGFVKVEEGCNWRCTYCVSSLERGEVGRQASGGNTAGDTFDVRKRHF